MFVASSIGSRAGLDQSRWCDVSMAPALPTGDVVVVPMEQWQQLMEAMLESRRAFTSLLHRVASGNTSQGAGTRSHYAVLPSNATDASPIAEALLQLAARASKACRKTQNVTNAQNVLFSEKTLRREAAIAHEKLRTERERTSRLALQCAALQEVVGGNGKSLPGSQQSPQLPLVLEVVDTIPPQAARRAMDVVQWRTGALLGRTGEAFYLLKRVGFVDNAVAHGGRQPAIATSCAFRPHMALPKPTRDEKHDENPEQSSTTSLHGNPTLPRPRGREPSVEQNKSGPPEETSPRLRDTIALLRRAKELARVHERASSGKPSSSDRDVLGSLLPQPPPQGWVSAPLSATSPMNGEHSSLGTR